MLYDQAQLISTYVEAYLVTGEDWLAQVVRDIVTYTENCLSDPSGGFYSAEDADSYPDSNSSSKKEGAFCVWSMQEIQSLLGKIPAGLDNGVTLADVVCHHYDVRANGNVDPFQVGCQFFFLYFLLHYVSFRGVRIRDRWRCGGCARSGLKDEE